LSNRVSLKKIKPLLKKEKENVFTRWKGRDIIAALNKKQTDAAHLSEQNDDSLKK
jgi:lambda repressor-like predicted transcriptional regulator